jgi:Tol biopolymer transport system component
MSTTLARSVAVLLLGAAAAACSGAAAAPPTPPIVFSADRAPSLSGEIYRLDADGRLVGLSNNPFADTSAVVSPDGRSVAFRSYRGDGVYVAAVDGWACNGSRRRRLAPTSTPARSTSRGRPTAGGSRSCPETSSRRG